jgi:DNA repair ATPase RecN
MTVSVENVGGIRSCQVTLDRGVTLLTGRNATNRTSLLRAIGAGLGGSSGELRADTDGGRVAVEFDGDRYTRTFDRDGESVRVGGDPYTDDVTVVNQYSCILADNYARDAVERGDADALREFIMAPVDTDEVREIIERKQRSVRSLRDELETAKRYRERRPELEEQLEGRRDELDDVRSDLESVRESVAEFEADVDAAQEAEAVVEDLKEAREEYERVQNRIETQRNALESLREERDAVESDLAETSSPETERGRIEDELERLQRRERELEAAINSLLSIVEFNEQLVEEEVPSVDSDAGTGTDTDGNVVEELDPTTRTVECWTCGTCIERQRIDDRLDTLRDVIDEKRRERNQLRSEIDDLKSRLKEVREAVQHRQSLETKLDDIDSEIDERQSRIERHENREAELRDRIETLETEAAESDDRRDSELLEDYQRLSELEYERGQLEEQIESLGAELATVREEGERVPDLEGRIDERQAELVEARGRIEELERSAVETFNEHIETVLDHLAYENVERVWIERTAAPTAGSDDVPESSFVLHVVRSNEDDAVYEDTVDHLSESEREVVGLVVALAGYLVHDVHETVPVMSLDSLEAIDADRIATLVEYFADFVPFLVVALLPEDAAALPEQYDRVAMGQAPA